MSRTRRPPLQWRLRELRRVARRERNLSPRPRPRPRLKQSWLRVRCHRQHLQQVNRDPECRAVVAAAEVVVEVVRGRELLYPRPQSPQSLLQHRHPQEKDPPRNRWSRGRRRLKLCRLPHAPARERWFWRSGCRDRARVHGSSGTTFIRFRAICCANFYSMTRRSSAFRIWSFPTCDRC